MGAFDGLKVADFTWAVAGPLTTKYLADNGATVVKVEWNDHPDIMRTAGPFKDRIPGINRGAHFAYFNANKFSIGINLTEPKGIEVAKKLIGWADIVAENFTPGFMERVGLDYEALKKVKPDIIMFRTSIQGQTGPNSRLPGFGFQLVGLAGFTRITGWEDQEPVQPFGAYTDLIAPRYGVAAIIAALDHRKHTGKGQCIDLSQLEASIQFLSPLIMDYTVNGRETRRKGNACEYAAPHNVYQCQGKQRFCAIAVFNDQEWQSLCQVMDKSDLQSDERFCTLLARKRNETLLDRIVQEWTIKHTPEEIMVKLQAAGVPAGIVENASDIWNDPQLSVRGQFWVQQHPEIGPVPAMGQAFTLSRTPAELKRPAPCLGEHTAMVCKDFLNIPDEELIELLHDEVVQ